MQFYFYRMTIFNIIFKLRKVKADHNSNICHYYIDITYAANLFLSIVTLISKIKFKKLQYELRHIKDNLGELIRIKIPRNILFELHHSIINSKSYKQYADKSWDDGRVRNYIEKSILEGYLNSKEDNIPKMLYLIHVVSQHNKETNVGDCTLVIRNYPWSSILNTYASRHQVKLMYLKSPTINNYNYKTNILRNIRKSSRLFLLFRNIIALRLNYSEIKQEDKEIPKLYVQGKGNINICKDGKRSDFFMINETKIKPAEIVYKYKSLQNRESMLENGIHLISGYTKYCNGIFGDKPRINRRGKKSKFIERKQLDTIINKYYSDKKYWYSLFKQHNIKLHLTWYDNDSDHMAIADAIKAAGGIATMWQSSFYGFKNYECKTNTDVMFLFSKYDSDTNQSLGPKNKYNIITGFIADYVQPQLLEPARNIRNRLKMAGAKKIVSIMDENSSDDPRWHTGHELQRENYSFILEEVLAKPWLGVVFKPKKVTTLRRRLGPVNELLEAAEKTGRCIVLSSSGKYVSDMPPLLAGMASDVVIHGHIHAGTAALECALQGKRTLLIDREGAPYSKLHELPEDKVVFKSWPDTINALNNYFESSVVDPEFGNWTEIINELDPYNDNRGSYRMSSYIENLLKGFKYGADRDTIMADAAQLYADKWGIDKIITN